MAYPVKDRYIPNKGTAGNSSWVEGDFVTAANMNHIEDGIDQMVQDAENYADGAVNTVKGLSGSTVPTSATVGTVGQKYLYTNGTTKIIYECVDASDPYVWEMIYRYNTTDSKWYLTDTDGDEIDISSLIDEFEGDIESVVKDIEDGTIEAGRAVAAKQIENISEDTGVTQEEPFVIQGTGTANGTVSVDTSPVAKQLEKQGNSVVVNQLVQGFRVSGSEISPTTTLNIGSSTNTASSNFITLNKTHTYFISVTGKFSVSGITSVLLAYFDTTYRAIDGTNFASNTNVQTIRKIFTPLDNTQNNYSYVYVLNTGSSTEGTLDLSNFILIDLTQWFNGNIPDDILADPKRFFNYYGGSLAYNAGTLTNGTGRYLVNKHRNAWDEEWEVGGIDGNTGQNYVNTTMIRSKNYIPVIPGGNYYFKAPYYCNIRLYDANKNYLGYTVWGKDSIVTISNNTTYYVRFVMPTDYGTIYHDDITISLYYEGNEGYDQYYAYEKPSVYETGTEVLRSIGDIRDIKKPDGTITRYVGSADLGAANWDVVSNYAYIFLSDRKAGSDIKYILSKPMPSPITNFAFNAGNSGVVVSYPRGSFTTREQLQQALNGIILYYELATPTTEQGTTFAENIQIDDNGTMAWYSAYDEENPNSNVLTGVPQGCKIFYPADYVLFLDAVGQRPDINWNADNIVSQDQLDEFETGARIAAKALLADNLESDDKIEDLSVYTMRQSPAGVGNGMLLDHITGATIAYNQRIQNGNFTNTDNWGAIGGSGGTLSASGNVLTLTLSGNGTNGILQSLTGKMANHKYLVMYDIKTSFAGKVRCLWTGGADEWVSPSTSVDTNANQWYHFAYIKNIGQTTTSGGSIYFYCYNSAVTSGTAQYRNIMMIDLTQMFGTTIANYFYNQGDTAGVNKFRILFPKPYYPYNAGELVSVKTAGRKTVEINQWDEEWELGYYDTSDGTTKSSTALIRSKSTDYIDIIGGATYYFKAPNSIVMMWYDGNKNFISYSSSINTTVDAPLNAKYGRFYVGNPAYGTTYNHDICINISDSSINGTYYPYEPNEYPCEQIELSGLYELDANNNLIADGDEYKNDGTVTRRYAIVSSADCTVGTYSSPRWQLQIPNNAPDIKTVSTEVALNMLTSSRFEVYAKDSIGSGSTYRIGKTDVGNRTFVFTIDSTVTTESQARTWVTNNPFYIIYEINTPTSEETSAASFASTQKTGVTEQFMEPTLQNPVFLPVGHDSFYLPDLKDKLEIAPDSPTTDGVYLVSRSSGTNVYIPITDVTATQSEIDEIIAILQ